MDTSIGQQLRTARESRGLTLEQVAQATLMRVNYLQALESGDYSRIPSPAQARGFLRAYANFLKLDPAPMLAALDGEGTQPQKPSTETQPVRAAEPQPGGNETASLIFKEIGSELQECREMLGLSLDDVERHTHLRQHFLEALESGDLDSLPSPVQGRGMLNNYARFLGLDADYLLLRFADGLQVKHAARQAARATPKPAAQTRRHILPWSLRRFISGDLLVILVVSAGMLIFVIWGIRRISAIQGEEVVNPTAPSIAEVLLATATASETFTPEPATTTPRSELALFPTAVNQPQTTGGVELPPQTQGRVQIYIVVHQRAYMRAVVDGVVEFDGRVVPGTAYNFIGESLVQIITGNGAALQVFFNQQDLGRLGDFGQVVDRMYSAEGLVTATPTITLTPSATPRFSATPSPSPSLTPVLETAPALP